MEKEWKAYEIGELDQYLFGQGNHYEIYKKLGAHMGSHKKPYDKGGIYRNLHMLCTGSKRRHDV